MKPDEKTVSIKRVLTTFSVMLLLPAVPFLIFGGVQSAPFVVLVFPAGILGITKYIYEPAFIAVAENLSPYAFAIGGWPIYLVILGCGLRFRSSSAYPLWVLFCCIIFLLTVGGCVPIAGALLRESF